ncbi:vascular endothelial growth factor A-A-like [Centruroides vittatus]|uniref:vascular endothelial growth factor A-A-like n=1 Tax=Centruroides vittatus TaxID=120091 RepID=UPI00351051F6
METSEGSLRLSEHLIRMDKFGRCKYPLPKVVNVWSELPEELRRENVKYRPKCTILYRCSDDSGCCNSDSDHCVAEKMEDIQLEFYEFSMVSDSIVQKTTTLTFRNHTTCECRRRNQTEQQR